MSEPAKRRGSRTVANLNCDRILQLAVQHDELWALTEKDGLRLWERVPNNTGVEA
jgi:hypothetical protein